MVWREPKNHSDDCYFCNCNVKGFNLKNKKQISYPNIPSAIRPVPHGPGIPVHSPPDTVENIFYSDTESECETDDDVDEVYDSIIIILYGCKSIPEFKEKLKIYEKLFNTSRTFRPNNDKKFDDLTHAAKFERKRTPNPQPICYSCGLKVNKSTQYTNKPHGKQCYGCKNFGHVHANCLQNSGTILHPNLTLNLLQLPEL
ncbi:hypothetical protein AVEN_163143-1 [Araneus ventricosus]|uniref:Uncharacterized protein n=1 Tax=Araneus ventricosus TaxID=182803 RepID=A0A4Y2DHE3_ARAVE|nr:hypothetical protein AVEN_163143-1 [Araneus ventricosus]